MDKWNVRSLSRKNSSPGCLMILVAILIVIFVILSLCMYFFDFLPRLFLIAEQNSQSVFLFLTAGCVFFLLLSFVLSYIGFSHAFIFCVFDLSASALAGYYFYRLIAAQPVSDGLLTDVLIAAWGAIVFGLAVSFVPSSVAASAVYFINVQIIKRNKCYRRFLHYLDSLLPTSRLYKVIITSEKVVMRSPTDSLWYMYFSDVGFDELYGRAFNAFVTAAAGELGRFRKSVLEDYCVVFTNIQLHRFLKKAKRQRRRDEKAGLQPPDNQLTTGLSDVELAYADERRMRDTPPVRPSDEPARAMPQTRQEDAADKLPASETFRKIAAANEPYDSEAPGPGFFKDDPYSIGSDHNSETQ